MMKRNRSQTVRQIGLEDIYIANFTNQKAFRKGVAIRDNDLKRGDVLMAGSLQLYGEIKIISDGLFDLFSARSTGDGKKEIIMDMSQMSNYRGGYEITSIYDYKARLRPIYLYLQKEYGITAGFSDAVVRNVTLDIIFSLRHPINEYRRATNLMMSLPEGKIDKRVIPCYFYYAPLLENLSEGIRFSVSCDTDSTCNPYKEGHPGNLIRFEFEISGADKIRELFGTSNIMKMGDEMFEAWLRDYVRNNLDFMSLPYTSNIRAEKLKKAYSICNQEDTPSWREMVYTNGRDYELYRELISGLLGSDEFSHSDD